MDSELKSVDPARPVVKEGDWVCQESRCSNINQDNRTTCEKCGRIKPRAKGKVGHEIGKDAAEKSKGLFSAEDWACSKCGNINWSRRTSCNICNAPKFGDVEARTGYGGGYMDRQDVEYVKRDDSDSEYDEFGRKRKKETEINRFKQPSSKKEQKLNDAEDEEDDDDDEEEEDDGDISKYVLDDELESNKGASRTKNGAESKKSETARRSRSRSSSRSSSGTRSYSSSSGSSTGSYSRSSSTSSNSRDSRGDNRKRKRSRSNSRSGSRPTQRRRHTPNSRQRSLSYSRSRSRSRSRSGSKRKYLKK